MPSNEARPCPCSRVARNNFASNAGSLTPDRSNFVTAVNAGVPGPSSFVQGDGSWDLLHVNVELPAGTAITGFTLTVTYTITWTEIDPTTLSYTEKSLTVSVTKERKAQDADISIATQTGDGHLVFQAKKLETMLDHKAEMTDSVPEFALVSAPTYTSYGQQLDIIRHPTHKSSAATRNYDLKKSTRIIAVNDGKVDGNARKEPYHNGSAGNHFKVCTAVLQKKEEWPCDDDVDATLTFTLDFVTLA